MTLQRKIYLSVLAISTFSFMACGKKAQNTDPTEGKIVTRTPALSANNIKLISSFDGNGPLLNDFYQFEDDAWLTIPQYVFVENGNPLNFSTRIYFNSTNNETLSGARELYCEYQVAKQIGVKSFDGYYHHFVGCFEDINSDGTPEEINYSPGTQVAQDKDRFIRLEFVSGFTDSETQVSSDIEIEWF